MPPADDIECANSATVMARERSVSSSSNALSATVGAEADAQRRLRLYVLLWTPFIAIQDIWLQYYIGCVAAAAAAAASAVASQSSSSLHFPPPPLPSLSLLGAPRFPRLAVTSR